MGLRKGNRQAEPRVTAGTGKYRQRRDLPIVQWIDDRKGNRANNPWKVREKALQVRQRASS
ncbi:hypothetical protein AVDCRST_MAG81-3928 [uncultured Synechococcales cyanobacterium]|uniref:Uncharacterized protein n=1 Tax=uncultured Synechococcales cyanobacterium TaxID=1936017 RepID=A0A6J4VSE3_9CYAN|nr:hypothetical protein AVDCRST_MAG81-3928 [uncultured Synechococcales cyanobacterium]